MAEEVEMTPVDATPSAPPIVNPITRKPVPVSPTATLKPGLKLPPKPGATVSLKPGLKLPPKPGATVSLKPGLKLPPKPVIHKPGATVSTAKPLPKPVSPVATPTAAEAKPAAQPMAVDAQGVGKLPTVSAQAIKRDVVKPAASENSKPMEVLKSVTQKLKGITQQIPQQAILRKTGIIADVAMTDAQKQAAKSKTARISLSDAMGVAPVKNEVAPIKTIRIKRPVGIPTASTPAPAVDKPAPAPAAVPAAAVEKPVAEKPAADDSATLTQRKTLKITRPGGGAVRPTGKFGIKRPTTEAAPTQAAAAPADGAVADISDIPSIPDMPAVQEPAASDGPAWLWTLSAIVQVAACAAIGALAWFLYQNTQTQYF